MSQMSYPVMEHFYTIQGEGYWSGSAAYFIRLAGCDVGCTWCDVKESWDKTKHLSYSLEDIVKWLVNSPAEIVVITGGEPSLYDLEPLTAEIKKLGKRAHIETSGTNPLTGLWDWVTFSPKRFKKHIDEYHYQTSELKMIIAYKNDLRWAKDLENNMRQGALLYIQPEWDVRKELEPLCIEFVKENPRWRLSLQTHKYLGID
jgi:7-carboxy-7-deazaguanine synthase